MDREPIKAKATRIIQLLKVIKLHSNGSFKEGYIVVGLHVSGLHHRELQSYNYIKNVDAIIQHAVS